MKNILSTDRTVLIHDFDNVHYGYHHIQDISRFLAGAKADAAALLLPDLSHEQAVEMGITSYHETKDGQLYYVRHAQSLGMDAAEFRHEFHSIYHQLAYQIMVKNYPHVFAPDQAVNAAFDGLRGFVRHGLLTQSCVDGWARPLLTLQKRFEYFDPDCLIGFAECDFVSKANSTLPLEKAIAAMKAAPEQVVFIEDTLDNLAQARELDPRILNVHIHHNPDGVPVPDYVDLSYETLGFFLKEMQGLHYGAKPAFAEPRLDMTS